MQNTIEMQVAQWFEQHQQMLKNIEAEAVLEDKLIVLIHLIIDVTATHLYTQGVKKHIEKALDLGLTQIEILEVFKLASVVGIHACALGVPLLEQELRQLGILDIKSAHPTHTPICDEMRENGSFNPLWETLYQWDPSFLEDFLKMATSTWKNNILPPLWIEFLCIAGDATITHMWAPGTQRHMQAALALGATQQQIIAVLKILSLQGIQSFELGVPILAEASK